MARTNTQTLIPLDRVARHLGINPWHFNGVELTADPMTTSCPDDWYQYSWQASGKLSREDLAFALRQAEDSIIRWLNWSPLPRWEEETITLEQHYRPESFSFFNAQGLPKSVISKYAKVIAAGAKATTLIDTPTITYSDPFSYGFNSLATDKS